MVLGYPAHLTHDTPGDLHCNRFTRGFTRGFTRIFRGIRAKVSPPTPYLGVYGLAGTERNGGPFRSVPRNGTGFFPFRSTPRFFRKGPFRSVPFGTERNGTERNGGTERAAALLRTESQTGSSREVSRGCGCLQHYSAGDACGCARSAKGRARADARQNLGVGIGAEQSL